MASYTFKDTLDDRRSNVSMARRSGDSLEGKWTHTLKNQRMGQMDGMHADGEDPDQAVVSSGKGKSGSGAVRLRGNLVLTAKGRETDAKSERQEEVSHGIQEHTERGFGDQDGLDEWNVEREPGKRLSFCSGGELR